jgi:predicted peptidase
MMDTDGQPLYRHLRYVPADYDPTGTERYPLLVFLHGAGERGDDLELIKKHGIPKLVEAGKQLPFIAVSPQCEREKRWDPVRVEGLVRTIEAEYRVDPDRIYLTGMSMGGLGTWTTATTYPDRFAALAPVCARGDPSDIARITHVPVWAFHGDADTVVPEEKGRAMVDALRAAGGVVGYTIYPGVGHDSWTATYNDERLYSWMLSNKRGAPPVAPPVSGEVPE